MKQMTEFTITDVHDLMNRKFNVSDVYELSLIDKYFLTTFVQNIANGKRNSIPIVILYGLGINGKSTLVREICKFLKNNGKETGRMSDDPCRKQIENAKKNNLVHVQDTDELSKLLPIMRSLETNFIVETDILPPLNYSFYHVVFMTHVFDVSNN